MPWRRHATRLVFALRPNRRMGEANPGPRRNVRPQQVFQPALPEVPRAPLTSQFATSATTLTERHICRLQPSFRQPSRGGQQWLNVGLSRQTDGSPWSMGLPRAMRNRVLSKRIAAYMTPASCAGFIRDSARAVLAASCMVTDHLPAASPRTSQCGMTHTDWWTSSNPPSD